MSLEVDVSDEGLRIVNLEGQGIDTPEIVDDRDDDGRTDDRDQCDNSRGETGPFGCESQPELVLGVHADYVRAGAELIETNTFGANPVKLEAFGLDDRTSEINATAARLARQAAGGRAVVLGAVGPLGIRIEPWGPTSVDEEGHGSLWRKALYKFRRDRFGMIGLAVVLVYAVVALGATLGIWGQDWGRIAGNMWEGPSATYWFGTNIIGQDIFDRAIYSTKTAFTVAT